jgi:hypothetical protein
VKHGERFWLYLYPRSITSLRHNWTHPAFPDAVAGSTYVNPSRKLESEQWLRNFCERHDFLNYDDFMRTVTEGSWHDDEGYNGMSIHDDYFTVFGSDASGEIPPELWLHVENVLGRRIDNKPSFFSCSC